MMDGMTASTGVIRKPDVDRGKRSESASESDVGLESREKELAVY